MKGKNFAFRLSGLYMFYLDHITKEWQLKSPTAIMKKILIEFILLKYGEDVQKNIKREYIESIL